MKILILGPNWRNDPIKSFLAARGHSSEIIDSQITLEFVQKGAFELILSSGYAYKVGADIVDKYFGKVINLHATYLPWGKGIGTTLFSFLEGTPKGVSLHLIEKEFDTGDIIAQKRVEPLPNDTLRTFYHRLLEETTNLFFENFESIAKCTFSRTPQLSINATVPYRSRVESEYFMDFLAQVWDTPLSLLDELGAEIALSENFWSAVESEIG